MPGALGPVLSWPLLVVFIGIATGVPTGLPSAYVVDGCPGGNGQIGGKKCVPADDTQYRHAIRCCAVGQPNTCGSPGSVCTSSQVANTRKATQPEAARECASRGLRLCTADELMGRTCCASGCGMDGRFVWSDTSCRQS